MEAAHVVIVIPYKKQQYIDLTFKTISPNHIELTDSHGDTIRLMRNG